MWFKNYSSWTADKRESQHTRHAYAMLRFIDVKGWRKIFLNVKTCSSQANNSSMVYRQSMAVFPVGPIAIIPRCVDDMF